jgi:hypothetical protein
MFFPGLVDLHAHYSVILARRARRGERIANPVIYHTNRVTSKFPAGEYHHNEMLGVRKKIERGELVSIGIWIDPCRNITGRTRACRGLMGLRGVSRRLVETESGGNERLYPSHPVLSRAQSASSAPYRTSRVPIEHLGMKKSIESPG